MEDNELNSEIAVEILKEYGFLVDTAGYEATRQIRALTDPALSGITILAMTANAFDEDRKKAMKCGMDGFLSKPIVIEELISTLQKNPDQMSGESEEPHK